ncbi:MAG: hypothetical protein JW709_14315 [Sedimentisphaerales bacterium]|nr:hypothetical protein [Sedimentisphaerales bacterium]
MKYVNITFVSCGFIVSMMLHGLGTLAFGSDFAMEVIAWSGPLGPGPYGDPNSVLGEPTTWILQPFPDGSEVIACSMVHPAYNTDPEDNKLVTTLNAGSYIIVGFGHNISDDPGNPYGMDFIVYGNGFFEARQTTPSGTNEVDPNTDMSVYQLANPTSVEEERILISVAQDPNGPWYAFSDGPYGDTAYPTQAFSWDANTHDWGPPMNWLRPINPALTVCDFNGLTVEQAIGLYDGSAGGTAFDLQQLAPEDYSALSADPQTSRKWIRYIKVEPAPGASLYGEIDAFADVAGCDDYQHPRPEGDLTGDCRVDLGDWAILAAQWQNPLTIDDLLDVAADWLMCTFNCDGL